MPEFIASIVVGILRWLQGVADRGRSAVDSAVDRDLLRRAGGRVREWMRKQDRSGVGGKSDQGGT